ncbi:hypothetical protein Q6A89_02040 [Aliarcobacter skirrowii]|uniref:hypothetical protein n=1 Tax=Aliarcobacter skirrowii TaxID=28200 RepID=UPI0029B9E426|nr:hypothetical protein [Aliarcobacter skirrowii]MDX4059289.1 hypothetical protein [Aliarcobacter skirrowii]
MIIDSIKELEEWFSKNGLKGWDPYDIKDSKIYLNIGKIEIKLIKRILLKIINISVDIFPNISRKILCIEPLENAKGIGLVLSSYCNLYKKTNDNIYLEKALFYANWLLNNKSKGYHGYSWGYPFDWKSNIFIPKNTPSSVVSYVVGNSFFSLYKVTKDIKYLEICKEICVFFTKSLNVTYLKDDCLCYSYTPLDDFQVHNANLFVGEFLSRIGKEINNQDWVKNGLKCANFAVLEQQKDGYLPYWALSQTKNYSDGKIKFDHYHSGFEIRMLYNIWKNTNSLHIKNAWIKYFTFYNKYLFNKEHIPKLTVKKFYPVNIHAIAESILCLNQVNQYYENKYDFKIKLIYEWLEKNMKFDKGEYCYKIIKLPIIGEYKVKIAMYRWGQAWIFYALTEYYCNKEEYNEK